MCGCTCACFVRHATSCVSLTAPPPRRPPCQAALLTLRPTGSDKCEMLTWCLVDPSRAPRCCSFSCSFSLSFHLFCSLPETIDTRSALPLNWSQLIVDGSLCRFWKKKKSLLFFFSTLLEARERLLFSVPRLQQYYTSPHPQSFF